jgi:hypothetical protein
MNNTRRNKILLWVIALGLANFVVYTLAYWYLGGDAPNGFVKDAEYHLRGHFVWALAGKSSGPVSRPIWLYSYIHSITIWPTIAAVLLSMLVLAKPHIIATMENDAPIGGRLFVNVCMTVIILVTTLGTILFICDFARAIQSVALDGAYNV